MYCRSAGGRRKATGADSGCIVQSGILRHNYYLPELPPAGAGSGGRASGLAGRPRRAAR
ncbi:MAG: hypothetical protein GYA39_02715 [Methanothrix sp.]|nr:hypothetical protein [Methanothrix sp.]